MSYKVDRLMSLGYDCRVAAALKELGLREPGPLDWSFNTNKSTSLIQLFTGDLYSSFIRGNYYSRTYSEYKRFSFPGADEFEFIGEDLDNREEYKKVLYRFGKMDEHIRKGGKFVYLTTPKDTFKKLDDFFGNLEYLRPDFDKRDILVIASPDIRIPTYCTGINLDFDYDDCSIERWTNYVRDALEKVCWIDDTGRLR